MNNKYLEGFYKFLVASNLSEATISKHYGNIHFFATSYLEPYEGVDLAEGIDYVDEFFSDWFIRKALWSDEASIKQNITSLKKFYKFLSDQKVIKEDDYKNLMKLIKAEKLNWIENVNRYNNVFDLDMDFSSTMNLLRGEMAFDDNLIDSPTKDYNNLLDELLCEEPWQVMGHLFPIRVATKSGHYFIQCLKEEDEVSISVFLRETLINSMMKLQSFEADDTRVYSAYLESYNLILDIDETDNVMVTTFKQDQLNTTRELENDELDEMFEALSCYVQLSRSTTYPLEPNIPGAFYCYENGLISLSSFDELHLEMVEQHNSILKQADLKRVSEIGKTNEKWFVSKRAVYHKNKWHWLCKITVDSKKELTCYTNAQDEVESIKEWILKTIVDRGKPKEITVEYEIGKGIEEIIFEELSIPLDVESQPLFPVYESDEISVVELTIKSKPVSSLKKALKKLTDEQLEFMSLVITGDFKSRHEAMEEIRSVYTSEFALLEFVTLTDMEYEFLIGHLLDESFDSDDKLEQYAGLVDRGYLLEFYYKGSFTYLIPDEIKISYTLLNTKELDVIRANYWLIADFINACVHFYGLIAIETLSQMAQENIDLDENEFDLYLNVLLMNSNHVESDETYLYDFRLIEEQHYTDRLKNDKPYYMPGFTELLKYKDFYYTEITTSEKVMTNYLRVCLELDEESLNYLIIHLRLLAELIDEQEHDETISEMDLEFDSEKQFDEFRSRFNDFLNTRRLKINHGYTNNELLNQSKKKIGRNDPCPCGSGKKFKKCCGKN